MKVENGAQDPLEERRPRVRHLRNGKTVDTLRSQTVSTAVLKLAKGRQKVLPEEPYALIGHVRDCGGGGEQSLLLPGDWQDRTIGHTGWTVVKSILQTMGRTIRTGHRRVGCYPGGLISCGGEVVEQITLFRLVGVAFKRFGFCRGLDFRY